ncbi:hypothetical protein B7R54_07190 [Subtercola boreus]|uniref:Uncharacterized protein n=1 Tax=Subtercola boreus TaxID=120213 RepID=A0A3E0VGJ2_9MICO|nr:hypothetical protein [Subtercola boreus]RFA09032.1 hypothetical protein B7R54_07190 [Subtercola boreus]TQL53969.1 hypothetical protein FB464_1493 [Subtercola boreus]
MDLAVLIVSIGALTITGIAATSAWVQAKLAVSARKNAEAAEGRAIDAERRALEAAESSAASSIRVAAAFEQANDLARASTLTVKDAAHHDLIAAISPLVSINVLSMEIWPYFETLRLRMITFIDRAGKDSELIGNWLDAERTYGLQCVRDSMHAARTVPRSELWASQTAQAMSPLHTWAMNLITNLRVWRAKGDEVLDDLVDQTNQTIQVTRPVS